MDQNMLVAVPSYAPGGLNAQVSDHFGHCDVFTLVKLENGKIGEVTLTQNIPHEQGGCLAPVNLLAGKGVHILIAGGMGMRPLQGFNSVGIEVFHNGGLNTVGQVVTALSQGRLPRFGQNNVCGGGGGACGGGH